MDVIGLMDVIYIVSAASFVVGLSIAGIGGIWYGASQRWKMQEEAINRGKARTNLATEEFEWLP